MSGPLRKALPATLRELRILCCQTSAESSGARNFVKNMYPSIKEHNPDLPILVRQAEGTPPRAFARFERGVEKQTSLDNADDKEVEKRIASLLQ